MSQREDIVVAVLSSAGGKLVSRVRLQKAIYLLEQLGLNSGFEFQYHHYGPYSREIDNALADAEAFSLIEEKFDRRKSDGARYSIFVALAEPKPDALGSLEKEAAADLSSMFAKVPVTILELAATAHWIWAHEGRSDWRDETVRRKGVKTQGGRLDQAIVLLGELGLAPEV